MTKAKSQQTRNKGYAAWRFLCILGLAAFTCLQAGCEKKVPSIDQKFVNAYTEMLIAEQIYGKDSPTAMLKRKLILDEAGYSREVFLKKANAILDNKDMWVPFQKAVIDRIDSLTEQSKAAPMRKRGGEE